MSWIRRRPPRGLSIAWAVAIGLAGAAAAVAGDGSPNAGRSGVELVGRGDEAPPPRAWWLVDLGSQKEVARVEKAWGFAPLPPGRYGLHVLPDGYEALELSWGEIAVEEGHAAKVELRSGIEVFGRDAQDAPLRHWNVRDRTGKAVAHTSRRWGFTALPPGEYSVDILPEGYEAAEIPWGAVTVAAGKSAVLTVDCGVTLAGRPGEDPPSWWYVDDAKTGERRAKVRTRWGFTPIPPGDYRVRLLPEGYEAAEIAWSDAKVVAGKATAAPNVDCGIALTGRPGDDPPSWWFADDAKTGERRAKVRTRWGFTPLPPGDYRVVLLPQGYEALEIGWSQVSVAAAQETAVAAVSGIDLVERPGEKAPAVWNVIDAATKKRVAHVRARWGFTPLPPGTYDVEWPPHRWGGTRVAQGQVARLENETLEQRLQRVTGGGRPTERQRDPEGANELDQAVERAVRRGVAWLRQQQDLKVMNPEDRSGYPTIGILALLHAEELGKDAALARASTDYLLRRTLRGDDATYATSLTAMALRDLSALRHRARIRECAEWLVENQGWDATRRVWGYGDPVPGSDVAKPAAGKPTPRDRSRGKVIARRGLVREPRIGWDNSNAQFAILGLHAAAQAGAEAPRESWERVEQHFRELQLEDGSWGYNTAGSTGSMTCAGIASMLVARHYLGAKVPAADMAVLRGLEWLEYHFTVDENPRGDSDHYYYLYGLERVGVLAGTEFIGDHEWYPAGARHLVRAQREDGSWLSSKAPSTSGRRSADYLDTCYALLFLKRATLPLDNTDTTLLSVSYDEAAAAADLSPSVELIFDASGSMKEPVAGKPKIEVARTVLSELIRGLPEAMRVGLRLYGHRSTTDKTDTQLVVPIGPLDAARREAISRWIATARPVGWTPMVRSLLQAKDDFPTQGKASRTVVLVSDGEETGGGRLEDVAAAYAGTGIEVVVHVVGFDVQGNAAAQQQMKEIARIGKGRYYSATSAGELLDALRSAVPALGFEVYDPTGKTRVARGSLNAEPIELKPGAYRVKIVGTDSDPLDVTLPAGEETTLRLERSGRLVLDRR